MPIVSDYLHSKASKNKIPLQGTFELSPVCNFSCRMCYVRRTPAQVKAEGKCIRDWKEWLELGKQCFDAGMLYVLLTGGEPFIYPGFRELYEGLHKMGIVIMINSNGTMIDEETVEWLKTMAPSRINITLYGSCPETYKRLCGRADGFERAKNAIIMLKEAGIPVVINASMTPENIGDLEGIIDFGKEHELNTRIATYMFPPARREEIDYYSRFTACEAGDAFLRKNKHQWPDEYKNILKMLLEKTECIKENEDDPDWGNDMENDIDHMRCRAGRSSFWVAWDGNMTACGMLPFPTVEHPFEEPFYDCWMKLTNAVREATVMRQCNKCSKKDICKPCVAMIYSETGGVDEKAPYLCEMTNHIIARVKEEISGEENHG